MVRRLLLLLLLLAAPARAAEDLIIEVEAEPGAPYVQAEVTYTVRLWRASSLQHGYLVMPEIPEAIVETLDESETQVERGGRRWRVIERRLAVFPQRSGRLTLPPPVFSGRETFLKGRELSLDVLPRPAHAESGWWAPARSLALREEWPARPLRVGEPVERVLTIEAEGLTGAQLPPLPAARPDGWRALPVTTATETRVVDGKLRGRRSERHVLVPEREGFGQFPPIRIAWWDSAAEQPREALLAARPVEVVGTATPAPEPARLPPAPEPAPPGKGWPLWPAAILLAVAAAIMLLRPRRDPLRPLKRACRAGDPRGARQALLGLLAAQGAPPSLRALAAGLNAEAGAALAELDRHLFKGGGWDARGFERAVLPALRQAHRLKAAAPSPLPGLAP